MKGSEPRHSLLDPHEEAYALAHLPRRLVGEGDREDFVGAGPAGGDQVGDARRKNPGLADAGAGENQNRPLERLDRLELLVVEGRQISRNAARPAEPRGRRRREMPLGALVVRLMRHGSNHALRKLTGAIGFVDRFCGR